MKWIIFQKLHSNIAPLNYSASIKIAYLLNQKIVSVGLDSDFYFFCEKAEKLPFNKKLEHLLELNKNKPDTLSILLESKENIKKYNKIKSKSSKHVVLINRMRASLEAAFREFQEDCPCL